MKKALLTKLFLFLTLGGMYAQLGEIDKTFNTSIGAGANKNITSVAVQTDGKIIIAGEFINYANTPKNGITRLNSDGTLDTTFDIGTGVNSGAKITSVKVVSEGKILIIGDFITFNGITAKGIARLNSDGTLDPSFVSETGLYYFYSIAVQTDGKILIAGYFIDSDGFGVSKMLRVEPNGSLDTTFNSGVGPNLSVREIIIKPNGKIVLIGALTTYAGISRNGIAQINADGTLDTTFNPGTGSITIEAVAFQSDGKVLIGGNFTSYNGTSKKRIVRLNLDGTVDDIFNLEAGPNLLVKEIVVQEDDKILIGGQFTSYDGISKNRITRLNADGSLDTAFDIGTGVNETVSSIALQTDGKILIAGNFTSYSNTLRGRLARINTDGTIDNTFFNPEGFASGSNNRIVSVALQADGKIIIAGAFTSYNGIKKEATLRLNADGTLDVPFNPITTGRGSAVEYCVVVQPDGKILLAGRHTTFDGTLKGNLIRMNAENGTLDETFHLETAPLVPDIYSIALQTDGKILIGGEFTSFGGVIRNHIARLNTNGTIDPTFDPGTGADNDVNRIVVQSDGKILIIGDFTSYAGVARNHIARLNPDGTLDTTFDPGTAANKNLYSIALQTDGKILIGGSFSTYKNTSINCIARLNTDGTLDSTFDTGTGANGAVTTIKLKSDGKILIGGIFDAYNDVARNFLAELNADGTLDSMNNLGSGINFPVSDMLIQPDGKIILVGDFTSYDDNIVGRVIRILSDTTPLANEEFQKESFMIYPNPARDRIYFSQDLTEIAVYDIQGKKNNVPYISNSADISALPQGIYILKGLENNGKIVTQKIVKN